MARSSTITIGTSTRGLHSITREVQAALGALVGSSVPCDAGPSDGAGVLHLFLQHTSASLVIQENADPSAVRDLGEFLDRLVPEGQSWHRHLDEGPDDTVSHMKAAILPSSLTVPVENGKLRLGTWQGIYLWEHRRAPHERTLVLTLLV